MSEQLRATLRAQVGLLSVDVTLSTETGSLVIVGPNGAGKSTLLSLLLGVRPMTAGKITIGETVLFDSDAGINAPVEHRHLGLVPQHYALFPHLNVEQQLRFALESSSTPLQATEMQQRIDTLLGDLSLRDLAKRHVDTLSGGERQRVALARALSVRPRALLLDEPLSALDVHSRREVRSYLARTLETLALPTVVVSHDPQDARVLGRRIVVLEAGHITQCGTWDELAATPATDFVREFASV